MVVDGHAHVFLKDMPLAGTRRYAPSHDATPADYLGLLDAHRVTHGVLVQPSFLGTGNDYLLAALRAHPQRLRGVVIENRDAMACMVHHDSPQTLHYCDPPYVFSTRTDSKADYPHEMTDEQHAKLARDLEQLEGMVIVSGYRLWAAAFASLL